MRAVVRPADVAAVSGGLRSARLVAEPASDSAVDRLTLGADRRQGPGDDRRWNVAEDGRVDEERRRGDGSLGDVRRRRQLSTSDADPPRRSTDRRRSHRAAAVARPVWNRSV